MSVDIFISTKFHKKTKSSLQAATIRSLIAWGNHFFGLANHDLQKNLQNRSVQIRIIRVSFIHTFIHTHSKHQKSCSSKLQIINQLFRLMYSKRNPDFITLHIFVFLFLFLVIWAHLGKPFYGQTTQPGNQDKRILPTSLTQTFKVFLCKCALQ